MAKVFLRVYNREIESMIEGSQLDEAVAHCQYILKTYPMHVDTYRLLGKAFLEAKRYSDAADIFQRVLMAVPDDFVSHVGMSIIRDDENRLDEAIWHMERAFEVQPSNSAIQGELRRLYGRRDGVEPNKIRLSRDALANMYSQGELFNQAIAEIRSVLAEDTNRPDLQVMLARAYYRSGRKVEAAEMAAALLKKYPFNLDSLRVLVDVLPGTARAENTQVYRQRLQNLDPYSSFAINSAFASDQVVDSAVSLERLDYKAGPTPVASQPDWASSLGIKLNDEKHLDTPPAWMQSAETPEPIPPSVTEPSISPDAATPAAEIGNVPEWMRSAGWQESHASAQIGSTESDESLPEGPIVKADIPDWLKPMAPSEATEEVNPEPDNPAESLPVGNDGIPVWLKPTSSTEDIGMTNLESQQPNEFQPADAADVPEKPRTLASTERVDKILADAPQQPENSQQGPIETQPVKPEELPDWLKAMAPAESMDKGANESLVQPVEANKEPVETQPEKPDELPDWLKSLAPSEAFTEGSADSQPPVFAHQSSGESQPSKSDDVPDWIKSMDSSKDGEEVPADASHHPVEPQPETGEPSSEKSGGIPEWFKTLSPTQVVEEKTAETTMSPFQPQNVDGVVPVDLIKSLDSTETSGKDQIEPPAAEIPSANAGPIPDWLVGNGTRADAAALTAKTMEQPASNLPVQGIPNPQESANQMSVNQPIPPLDTSVDSFQPTGDVRPLNIDDDAFNWLESLAAKQGARPEELLSSPGDRSEEMPDWLRQTGEKPAAEPLLPAEQPAQAIKDASPVSGEKPSSVPPSITNSQPANQKASGADDTMIWLEQMAAEQGTKPEKVLTTLVTDTGETPDRIQKTSGNPPADSASEEMTPATPGQLPGEEDITITSWLSKKDVKEALEKKAGEKHAEIESNPPSSELPDWLKVLDRPAGSGEAAKVDNELPEWLRYSNPSEMLEPVPPTPAAASTPESEPPAWLDESVSSSERAVPTLPEEWLPAEEVAGDNHDVLPGVEPSSVPEKAPQVDSTETPVTAHAPTSEGKKELETLPGGEAISPAVSAPVSVPAPVRMPTLKQTGMLSHIPVQDKDSELLSNAQDVLDQNSLNDAMKLYSKLIKKGRLLDEVIHDLREAIYRYPVDVIIWQTLGDAYMRANRLQDALDAYTKAEELLR
jgi:tetratricopeptide (TPR) repeat protein